MFKPSRITLVAGLLAAAFSSANADDSGSHHGNDDNNRINLGNCASGASGGGGLGLGLGQILNPILDLGRLRPLQVVGLTSDQRLVCFNEKLPQLARTIGSVNGLVTDTKLVGIDFRVQNGKLYGVGNMGGVYILSTADASATLVNRLSVALSGTSFGVDFNPAADRLRVTSDNGQNLRHNVNAGGVTVVDGTLSYTPTPPATATTATGIVGSAYTNNDLDANTATTLYALDSKLDQIALQVPANAGTLNATGKLTINAGLASGFDIYSIVRAGVTVDVQALASFTGASGGSALYSVKLPTGKATPRGQFASHNQVTDIAIPLNQL